jgi:hypothetical protein
MATRIKGRAGRRSIFGTKVDGARVQGVLTKPGSKKFEDARRRLGHLAGYEPEQVSDGDTIEFLAIGERATLAHLANAVTR